VQGVFNGTYTDFISPERIVVFSALFLGTYLGFDDILVLIVSCFFSFFFWHDGIYEAARGRIDQYGKNFKSTSSTSTAKWNPSWDKRRIMKALSLAILTGYIIYKF
jgi:hypothetical protein